MDKYERKYLRLKWLLIGLFFEPVICGVVEGLRDGLIYNDHVIDWVKEKCPKAAKYIYGSNNNETCNSNTIGFE